MEQFLKEIITSIYPFSELSKKQKENLVNLCNLREYRPQDFIYYENTPTDKIYIILTGRLVVLSKENDSYVEIELIKRATIFGIISFFTEEAHSVSVKALEKSQVIEIPNDAFKAFLKRNPSLTIKLSAVFSQRVKRRTGQPKKIFQSVKAAIISLQNNVGKTTYLENLAKSLASQTSKKIIIVQFLELAKFNLTQKDDLGNILDIAAFNEETIRHYIDTGLYDYLHVKMKLENFDLLFSLLNYLSENYHFVLFELPSLSLDQIKGLINYADFIHLLTTLDKNEQRIINRLLQDVSSSARKLKIISSDFLEKKTPPEFKVPIYATIPDFNRTDYHKVIRRICREFSDKTVGLVLGSGLSFGLTHIGVLEVFEENKIPIDIIAGSSIGALIGALWALGYSTVEIKQIAFDVGKKLSMMSFSGFSFPLPFRGFFRAKKFENLMKEIFREKTFYDLKHSLRITAFDFIKREAVVIKEGLLYKAVAASCSMPGVFEPVISKNEVYFDGGILNPLPVKPVVDYAKKIIAVNITPSKEEVIKWYRERRGMFNVLDFIFGSIETMQREFILEALKISDVCIHPDLEGLSWVSFSKLDEFVKRGRQAALDKLEEIKTIINS